jgi:hypothetical protein
MTKSGRDGAMKIKYGLFKLSTLGLVLPLVFAPSLGAQRDTNRPGFRVWLDVSNTCILPMLSVQAALHVKNTSTDPVTVNVSPSLYVSVRVGDGEWKPYHPDGVPIATPAPPQKIRFSPGQELDFPKYIDSTSLEGSVDLLENPGIVQVRVNWGPFQAEPATITVLQPTGEDLAVFEELKHSPVSKFLRTDFVDRYLESNDSREQSRKLASNAKDEAFLTRLAAEQSTRLTQSMSGEKELLAFIDRHPASNYAKHARLALALIALEGTSGPPDRKRAREILIGMHAQNELFTESAHYLGKLEESEGNLPQALTYFQEAAENGTNPYYKFMARQHLNRLSAQRN